MGHGEAQKENEKKNRRRGRTRWLLGQIELDRFGWFGLICPLYIFFFPLFISGIESYIVSKIKILIMDIEL
jgi:hypothetical protein